jgi:quercetin dioxygenase-like cupin family protein
MKTIAHHRLLDMQPEQVNPNMTRRLLWGERIMVALMEFKQGFVVPTHQHENEQLTYCLSGLMRFHFSDREVLVRPGEVLLIPGGVPHGAEFVEDTVEMDVFSPPRQDWIEGTDTYLRR